MTEEETAKYKTALVKSIKLIGASVLMLILCIVLVIRLNKKESDQKHEKDAVVYRETHASLAGKYLFESNCVFCHKTVEVFVGPALRGARKRWESPELLHEFVRNPAAVIAKNDYAKKLYEQFNKMQMTAFSQLSDKEIDDILDYCEPGTY